MDLNEFVRIQREFDGRHGWTPDPRNPAQVCEFIARDLIGLFGEMGEFANIVKKLQLHSGDSEALQAALLAHGPGLREELIDFMIYVFRFASHLDADLEIEYRAKLTVNESRFREFLQQSSKKGREIP